MTDLLGAIDYEKIKTKVQSAIQSALTALGFSFDTNSYLYIDLAEVTPVTAENYGVDVSTSDLVVTLDKGGYKTVQVDVSVTAATTITVEYSHNGTNWWTYYTSAAAETSYNQVFSLAARYVKVTVTAVAGGTANVAISAVP